MTREEYEFESGCMQEGSNWRIVINHRCSELAGGKPCKHCYNEKVETHTRVDGGQWIERVWICPRVVVAYNEGGFNSTIVCLDCILDAVTSLSKQKS